MPGRDVQRRQVGLRFGGQILVDHLQSRVLLDLARDDLGGKEPGHRIGTEDAGIHMQELHRSKPFERSEPLVDHARPG